MLNGQPEGRDSLRTCKIENFIDCNQDLPDHPMIHLNWVLEQPLRRKGYIQLWMPLTGSSGLYPLVNFDQNLYE